MQRQRGELVPIGEAFSGLDAGPLQAIRDADLGFMARLMALCSLPRTNPGNRLQ